LFTAESLASRFQENVEIRVSQGIIRRDETYPHWMEAFHQALEMEQIPSSNNGLLRDLHLSTSSHSPAGEPRHSPYEPLSHPDSTPTDEPPHLQSSSLNDPTISTNSEQFATPPDPSNLAHSQDSEDMIEDLDISIDANFTELFNILEDAPIDEYDWDVDRFGYENSDYLMNLLEEEIQLPTAGLAFKNDNDRNKGLERPALPD
jgi:hypothetical protein